MAGRKSLELPPRLEDPAFSYGAGRRLGPPVDRDLLIGANADGTLHCLVTLPDTLTSNYEKLGARFAVSDAMVNTFVPKPEDVASFTVVKVDWIAEKALFDKDQAAWKKNANVIWKGKYCNQFNFHVLEYARLKGLFQKFGLDISDAPTVVEAKSEEKNANNAADSLASFAKTSLVVVGLGIGVYFAASLAIQASKK